MSKKQVLKGLVALIIKAHQEDEVVAKIAGPTCTQNLKASSLIVSGETHSHDPIVDSREVPEDSRWLISTEETGTLFLAPSRSEFVLPSPPKDSSPLNYELVGRGIETFSLVFPVPAAPSSLVFLDCGMASIKDGKLNLNNVKGFMLKVTTCIQYNDDGSRTYMYRVTGKSES